MKPWDSARALQVCGENPKKFIFGELNISVLLRDGIIDDLEQRTETGIVLCEFIMCDV